MLCGAALIASSVAYAGDAVSDKEMADRYSQAALSGDSDAQFYLGALYSSGVGRPRSDEEAFRWFSRAADQGHSHAMLVLSGIYAVGRGVSKDNFNAYKWAYIVAVGSRVDEFRNGSRQLMGVLETRMTRDDVDRAKAEAGRWHATSSQPKLSPATTSLRRNYPRLFRNRRPRRRATIPPLPAVFRGRATPAKRRTIWTRYWIECPPDCASGSAFDIIF
jgi:hypothetical protein